MSKVSYRKNQSYKESENIFYQRVGFILFCERERRQCSIKDMATLFHVSAWQYRKWELGKNRIPLHEIMRLSKENPAFLVNIQNCVFPTSFIMDTEEEEIE